MSGSLPRARVADAPDPSSSVKAPARVLAVVDGHRLTGPAKQLLALAAAGSRFRIDVRLGIFQRPAESTPLVEAARASGVPVRVVRDRFPGDPRTVSALISLARSPDVDVLQTHGYKANVFGLAVATAARRPWIAFLHGETWENRKVCAYYALERWAVRRADRVVVVSREMARAAVAGGIPSAKVEVVHNACLVGHEEAPRARTADAPLTVGVIARLSPEKGVDRALLVHGMVLREAKDAQLVIAGEGPEKVRLERSARELGISASVQWLGYREDVAEVYRRLAVLLIPSRSEGLPNAAIEAMAYGVPVVASEVGGLAEIVTDGLDGFLVPPDDTEGLARRILEILGDPGLRERLGRRAVDAVASRFSLDARARILAGIYEQVRR
jgi:glycosyltransferase involved in cell wall biosynthesis